MSLLDLGGDLFNVSRNDLLIKSDSSFLYQKQKKKQEIKNKKKKNRKKRKQKRKKEKQKIQKRKQKKCLQTHQMDWS